MDSTLENGQGRKKSAMSSVQRYLAADVDERWTDLPLLACCFITGLLDSAVFNVWQCFVGMQTGNTIYTGLGVSGQPASQPYRWVKSGTAILSFMGGCYIFSRIARAVGPLRRGTMIGSFVFQAALCFAPAILSTTGVVPSDAGDRLPKDFIVLLPLSMLAAQSGGQIVTSRLLGQNAIPTVVLTSTYCDLIFDPSLFSSLTGNVKRNQRAASAVLVLAGAIIGGFLTRGGDISVALWVCGVLKVALAISWCFWRVKGAIRLD